MKLRTQRSFPALLALAVLFALAWLPTAAQAQISLNISPATITAAPGATDVSVFGTLTNTGTASVDLDNAFFNLISGPTGADLTSAVYFSGYSAPFTLTAGQVYSGALFTFSSQPDAVLGDYTGNFSATYGGKSAGQDLTVTLKSTPAVPEASTTVSLGLLLTLGLGSLMIAAKRKKAGAAV